MKGKYLVIGLLVLAALTGVSLWYAVNYAHYDRVEGVDQIVVNGKALPVQNYRGLDGTASPLKLRACFEIDPSLLKGAPRGEGATALRAPNWFSCFNAREIDEDIRAGVASVIRKDEGATRDFAVYIAYYPDGRAYLWQQMTSCGVAKFGGHPLPPECGGEAASSIWAIARSGEAKTLPLRSDILRGAGPNACFETGLALYQIQSLYQEFERDPPPMPQKLPACFPENFDDMLRSEPVLFLKSESPSQIIAIMSEGRGFLWEMER